MKVKDSKIYLEAKVLWEKAKIYILNPQKKLVSLHPFHSLPTKVIRYYQPRGSEASYLWALKARN